MNDLKDAFRTLKATPIVTLTIDWHNAGAGAAVAARLTDALPAGAAFVSATGGGTFSAGRVVWDLGDLAPGAAGTVTVSVALPSYGSYANSADFSHGMSIAVYVGAVIVALGALAAFAIPTRKREARVEELAPAFENAA